jgi:hypothetical protein
VVCPQAGSLLSKDGTVGFETTVAGALTARPLVIRLQNNLVRGEMKWYRGTVEPKSRSPPIGDLLEFQR